MDLSGLISIVLLSISIVISPVLMFRCWRMRDKPGSIGLLITVFFTALWSFGYLLEIALPGLTAKLFWAKFQYIGIALLPVSLFLFGLMYSGNGKWLTRWRLIGLLVIPSLTILAAFTNELHHLILTRVVLQGAPLSPLDLSHGLWFTVNLVYAYTLLLITTIIFVRLSFSPRSTLRYQARLILAALLVPWFGNVLYFLDISPVPNLDFTPLAFTITNVLLVVSLTFFRLFDITPVAHKAVFDAMKEAILVLDVKNGLADMNAAAQKLFGLSTDWFGLPLAQLLPEVAEMPAEARQAGSEIRLTTGDQERFFALDSYPLFDWRQRPSGRLLVLDDITEQKQAEAQIELQITALEAASNGIVITDREGSIIWANPAFTRLTGYSLEEALGANPRLLKSGKHDQEFYRNLWDTILSGEIWQGEVINRRKDGSEYIEEMTISPLVRQSGEISHFIAIKQDVTQRIEYERGLVEANRMKTQLLASVSHDLRTPLSVILGYTDMLREGVLGPVSDQQAEVYDEVMESAYQLEALVDNLVGQTQLAAGRLTIHPQPFESEELVVAVRSAGSLLAKKKGLALEFKVDPNLPDTLVGDVNCLKQIVVNLAMNAIKYTDQGQVEMQLSRIDEAHWAIQVSDTGIGIPKEAQTKIFEPFNRVERRGVQQRGGSGLGLSIVRNLVDLMHGEIELESEAGAGAVFRVILPLDSLGQPT